MLLHEFLFHFDAGTCFSMREQSSERKKAELIRTLCDKLMHGF